MISRRTATRGIVAALALVALAGVARTQLADGDEDAAPARPRAEFVRGCAGPLLGDRLHRSWRRRSINVGRVSLLGLRSDWARSPADRFESMSGAGSDARYVLTRVPVRIARGRATLAVAPAHRDRAALAYDPRLLFGPAAEEGLRIADGHQAVRFDACRSRPTVHDGALVVAGPGCVAFDVWLPGRTRPARRVAPFGVTRC